MPTEFISKNRNQSILIQKINITQRKTEIEEMTDKRTTPPTETK